MYEYNSQDAKQHNAVNNKCQAKSTMHYTLPKQRWLDAEKANCQAFAADFTAL